MKEVLLVFGGIIFGLLLGEYLRNWIYQGIIKIDTSDPTTDRYMLMLTVPLDRFQTAKSLVFKVSYENFTKDDAEIS